MTPSSGSTLRGWHPYVTSLYGAGHPAPQQHEEEAHGVRVSGVRTSKGRSGALGAFARLVEGALG